MVVKAVGRWVDFYLAAGGSQQHVLSRAALDRFREIPGGVRGLLFLLTNVTPGPELADLEEFRLTSQLHSIFLLGGSCPLGEALWPMIRPALDSMSTLGFSVSHLTVDLKPQPVN